MKVVRDDMQTTATETLRDSTLAALLSSGVRAPARYLTGVTSDFIESTDVSKRCGLLVQPGNRYDMRVSAYSEWAGDNGVYAPNGSFCPTRFRTMMRRPDLLRNAHRCRFVVAPDVLYFVEVDGKKIPIGDALATLRQFTPWAIEIANYGYPVAFVAQDGLENMLDDVPWDLVDVLFVGGSDVFKLGEGARECVARAQVEGKATHMGRVNSYKRLALANSWGMTTADGTFLRFGPTTNVPRLISWLDKLDTNHMRKAS